jgi:hypothetical protein
MMPSMASGQYEQSAQEIPFLLSTQRKGVFSVRLADQAGAGMQSLQSPRFPVAVPQAVPTAASPLRLREVRRALESAARRALAERRFQEETAWLADNSRKYEGTSVALRGCSLLSVGMTAREVFAPYSNESDAPTILRIPAPDLPFAGW